jgi:lipopolysaccharide transport system ATP-binding protein
MKPIVRVDSVSKRYRIGANAAAYRTLRETLTSATAALRRPFRRNSRNDYESIWALQDVSFEIAPGEVVGIIGRNGAGKSTLLKILSRITEPTRGRVELFGRVGSLLEVGTGFHPELTARENIYLNGAVLGMRHAEIRKKFDEIVAFSEVEKFIDTPVKHFSSGMYVRLAFAVAAHLEPEILIVDEVLSVGDASFQKKCLGKMGTVAKTGRTVLFVSHNLGAVTQLCNRGIVLNQGTKVFDGDAPAAVSTYIDDMRTSSSSITFANEPDKDMQILSMSVVSTDGEVINSQVSRL